MSPNDRNRISAATLTYLSEPGRPNMTRLIERFGIEGTLAIINGHAPLEPVLAELSETESHWLQADIGRWRAHLSHIDAASDLARLKRHNVRFIMPGDDEWPTQLDDLHTDRPIGLWVRGPGHLRELLTDSVAVIGHRATTDTGREIARHFSTTLAAARHTVISGGGIGIDETAHRAALTSGTVAFLAAGLDNAVSASNAALLDDIAAEHAVVSEAGPHQRPSRDRFLQRGRLIAAAATSTIVIEASQRTGAVVTAQKAAELNRTVAAVSGRPESSSSDGCRKLIRQHTACPTPTPADLLDLMSRGRPRAAAVTA